MPYINQVSLIEVIFFTVQRFNGENKVVKLLYKMFKAK